MSLLLTRPWLLAALLGVLGCTDRADWAVTVDGAGPIRFGMTPSEAAAAVGVPVPSVPDEGCEYWAPDGAPAGLSFMIENGRVVRADIDRAGVRTLHGLEVGSRASAVRDAFGPTLLDEPHKYDWEAGWRYLTVSSADSLHGLIFEVDSQVVREYRAGLWPAVGYVEHCS